MKQLKYISCVYVAELMLRKSCCENACLSLAAASGHTVRGPMAIIPADAASMSCPCWRSAGKLSVARHCGFFLCKRGLPKTC